jgi:hypothetical protein
MLFAENSGTQSAGMKPSGEMVRSGRLVTVRIRYGGRIGAVVASHQRWRVCMVGSARVK